MGCPGTVNFAVVHPCGASIGVAFCDDCAPDAVFDHADRRQAAGLVGTREAGDRVFEEAARDQSAAP